MTEDEYSEFLKDKKELEELRRIKASFPDVARRYFEHNAFRLEQGFRLEHVVMTKCAQEESNCYCDFCPFPSIFGCPLGHLPEYSK
jgi:hypothetical protein